MPKLTLLPLLFLLTAASPPEIAHYPDQLKGHIERQYHPGE